MDDGGVARACGAASAAIADARAELLAAAAVEWSGSAAERFGTVVEDLLTDLVRASRRLEHARALAAGAARVAAVAMAGAAGGAAGGVAGGAAGGAAWGGPATRGGGSSWAV